MKRTATYNTGKLFITIITIGLLLLGQTIFAQTQYNDGRIRLRVWLHKVWTNANCSDFGAQEYVYKGIKVRPDADITGIGWSPTGLNIKAQGTENRWWNMNQTSGIQKPGASGNWPMTQDGNGILMLDITYQSTAVPTSFDWSINEMWEDDDTSCPWPCDGGTSSWNYDDSFCCGALGDDDYVGYQQSDIVNPFRGAPEGEVRYIQTDVIEANANIFDEDDQYSMIFAFQWDWVDPLPPLCSSPNYNDGPIDLTVELAGVWFDNDYDYGITCVAGLAGLEDLRMKWRATDNLAGFSGAQTCEEWNDVQQVPQWNSNNLAGKPTFLNKTYSATQTNFHSFNLEFELWEEDSGITCGTSCNYDTGCWVGIEDDDYIYGPTATGPISWRDSPPNMWNYLDLPVRASSGSYQNYTVWIRYQWTIGTPTVTAPDTNYDRTICDGQTTTIDLETENATYFQWQYTDVTGPTGPGCPSGATWTDLAGEVCEDLTISCNGGSSGTRIYRLKMMNRNGLGSTTDSGPRLLTTYSDCYRITCFPAAPPIVSIACGGTAVGGIPYSFSVVQPPDVGGIANISSYTWSVNPSAGVTISNPNSPSTDITFPETDQSYVITITIGDPCGGQTDATATCNITVTQDYCGAIHVSPSGNNSNTGGPDAPVQTISQAIAMSASSAGTRNLIKIAADTYTESNKLQLHDNVILDGDYSVSGSTWTKNTALTTTININSPLQTSAYNGSGGTTVGFYIGVEAIGKSGFDVNDIIFNVKNGGTSGSASGTTGNRGRSIYGFYFRNSTGFNVNRCIMNTGNATNGVSGVNGANGANGNSGAGGGTGHCDNNGGGGSGGQGAAGKCSGTRYGGAGGNGGKGASDGGNNNADGSNGGNGGGGAAGGSIYGAKGASGGCGQDCNRDGRKGQNGANGANGTNQPNTAPATSTTFHFYWLPNGQSTAGTDGGGGGGGEGGGGGGRQNGTWCDDGQGSGGGGGGGGACGGVAGTGGWGGGSSFAIYMYSGNGAVNNTTLNAGAAGNGGIRGLGGNGGIGGTPGHGGGGSNTCHTCGGSTLFGRVCGNCEVGAGGRGGFGGDGGAGGDGRPGGNGYSNGSQTVSSASLANNNLSQTGNISTSMIVGCTNSAIPLTSTLVPWTSYGNGGQLVNDITSSSTGFSPANASIEANYTSTGDKTLVAGGSNFINFLNIQTSRTLPIIDPISSPLCEGETIDLQSTLSEPNGTLAIEWSIQEMPVFSVSSPIPIYTFDIEDPGIITLPNSTTSPKCYQIKLRVQDECCGWSIPVYEYVIVEPPIDNNTLVPPAITEFCDNGNPTIISGSIPTGGDVAGVAACGIPASNYNYNWEIDSGGGFTSVGSGQNYDPSSLGVGTYYIRRIVEAGECNEDTSNVVEINVYESPTATITPNPVSVCANQDVQIFGGAVAGTGSITTHLWTGTGTPFLDQVNISNPTFSAPATGTFNLSYTVTDEYNCTATDNVTITINPEPTVNNPGNSTICSGDTYSYTPSGSVASGTIVYYVESDTTGGLISGNSDELLLIPPDDINDVLVNTGTTNGIVTYTVTPGTDANCSGDPISFTVTVEPAPQVPTSVMVDNNNICESDNGNITLTAVDGVGTDVNWFSGSCGGTSEGTGNPLIIPSPTTTTTYYAQFEDNCNNTSTCASVTVTILPAEDATFTYPIEVCINGTNPSPLSAPTTSGGNWTVSGGASINSSGVLDLSSTTAGQNYTVTYTTTGSCPGSHDAVITINAEPNVNLTLADSDACINETSLTLSGGTPAGGTFSGTSVSGNTFNPNAAGLGTHTITYTYTDGNSCVGTDTQDITVYNLPSVTLTLPDTDACVNETTVALSGGTPTGGSFSGPGVSGTNFDPSVAGVGNHTITYEYTDGNGCTNTATDVINVTNLPTVSLSLPDTDACVNETTVALSGGTPTGGSFSGPGVSGTNFDPSVAGVGNHTITYEYTDGNGCTNTAIDVINVTNLPTVIFNLADTDACIDESTHALSGQSPAGGTFSGTGVSGTNFDPSSAGLGNHTITYTYTDPSGCSNFATQTITVHSQPTVTYIPADPDICINETSVTLSGGSPAGGTYIGTGVTGNTFDPSVSGQGTHFIVYSYTDANNCTNSAFASITVHPVPTISGTLSVCVNETTDLDGTGSPAASVPWTSSNTGVATVENDGIVTGVAAGTADITYTDQYGCQATETVNVDPNIVPDLTAIGPLCQNTTAPTLPSTDNNSITGTWSPATISTTTVGTTTYTFTPDAGQGCTIDGSIDITIDPEVVPDLSPIGPLCQNTTAPTLPSTDNNSITGTWSPATISTTTVGTTTYTFTPDAGQGCTIDGSIDITIDPEVVPDLSPIGPLCQNTTAPSLPSADNNGITGTWSPSTISTTTSGTTTYTFTPDAGQGCTIAGTIDITIDPEVVPDLTAIGPLCQNTTAPSLPSADNNGITGTWSPSTISTTTSGTTTYTFTPDANQGCTIDGTLDITIDPEVVPDLSPIGPLCQNTTAPSLPSADNNGTPELGRQVPLVHQHQEQRPIPLHRMPIKAVP